MRINGLFGRSGGYKSRHLFSCAISCDNFFVCYSCDTISHFFREFWTKIGKNEKTENTGKWLKQRKNRLIMRLSGLLIFGRSGGTRTRGLLVPNQARYQTALHPDIQNSLFII